MKKIGQLWKYVLIVSVVVLYLYMNVANHFSLEQSLPYYLGLVLLTGIVFIGNILGNLGIIIYSITKSSDIAIFTLKIAMALGAYSPTALNSFAYLLLRKGDYQDSLAVLNKAESNTNYYLLKKSILVNKALCYWKLGRINDAIAIYEQLVKTFQTESVSDDIMTQLINKEVKIFNTNDYVSLSYLYLLNGQEDACEALAKVCLEIDPNIASAYDNLGQLYYLKGDTDSAISAFDKALSLKSTLADSLYYLSLIYFETNMLDLSAQYLNRLSALPINGLSSITRQDVELLTSKLRG